MKMHVISLQKWNHAEWQCECKKQNDWGSCIDYYTWNPIHVIVNVTRHLKLMNICILKIVHVENMYSIN